MAEIEGAQHFEDIIANIKVVEVFVQSSEINISCVYIFHYQCGCLGQRVSDNVDQVDNVDAPFKSLQDLNLSSDLGLLDRLKYLDDNSLACGSIDTFVHFGVLSTADLLDDLIIFLRTTFTPLAFGILENVKR